MVERISRFVALAALTFWIGGTTFYALVVVPTGTRVLGATEQGVLTEQVTRQLNWIGMVAIIVLAVGAFRSRLAVVTWLVLAASVIALFLLHPRIGVFLNRSEHLVTDYSRFYIWHRIYLLVTALQFLAGLTFLWTLASPSTGNQKPSGPQPYDMRKKNMAC